MLQYVTMKIPTTLLLRPSDVLYSKDSISLSSSASEHQIVDTFRQLVDGLTKVSDVRPITVFRFRSKYWTYNGNRRLLIFRMLEEFGLIDTISVNVINLVPPSGSAVEGNADVMMQVKMNDDR